VAGLCGLRSVYGWFTQGRGGRREKVDRIVSIRPLGLGEGVWVIGCLLASLRNLPGGMEALRIDAAGRPVATGRSDRPDPLVVA